jgi:hypothetical protein
MRAMCKMWESHYSLHTILFSGGIVFFLIWCFPHSFLPLWPFSIDIRSSHIFFFYFFHEIFWTPSSPCEQLTRRVTIFQMVSCWVLNYSEICPWYCSEEEAGTYLLLLEHHHPIWIASTIWESRRFLTPNFLQGRCWAATSIDSLRIS